MLSSIVVRVDRLVSGDGYKYAAVKAPPSKCIAGVDRSPGDVRRSVEEYFGCPVQWTGGAANEMEMLGSQGTCGKAPNDPKLRDGGGLARPLPNAPNE